MCDQNWEGDQWEAVLCFSGKLQPALLEVLRPALRMCAELL